MAAISQHDQDKFMSNYFGGMQCFITFNGVNDHSLALISIFGIFFFAIDHF